MRHAPPQHFPYDAAAYERLPCNLCGRDDFVTLAERDRQNLVVRTAA